MYEKKWRLHQSLGELSEKLRTLKDEASWAQVAELEAVSSFFFNVVMGLTFLLCIISSAGSVRPLKIKWFSRVELK